jgi:hypothetical protein
MFQLHYDYLLGFLIRMQTAAIASSGNGMENSLIKFKLKKGALL